MSLWFFGKRKGGFRSLYSVSVPIMMLVSLALALAIALWQLLFGNL